MKRGTTEHPKLAELCDRLKIHRCLAVGILESLWHFTAKFAPQGDIGKYSNAAIAKAIDWDGDPDSLFRALVESGWIERCDCHRLVIHDWPDHADQTLKRLLASRSLAFIQHDASREKPAQLTCKSSASLPVPVPVPVPAPVPERGKIAEFPSKEKTTKNGMLDPSKGFDFEAAFEKLYETHDGHARHGDCKAAVINLLVERTNPEAVCTTMQTAAEEWNGYWRATGRSPTGLLNWILSGDWEKRPPPIPHKATHSKNQEAERLFFEGV